MYECGIIDVSLGHEECGKADSVPGAMALADEIEIEFTGMPIKQWRYDTDCGEWTAESNDAFETLWYIREITSEDAARLNVPYRED